MLFLIHPRDPDASVNVRASFGVAHDVVASLPSDGMFVTVAPDNWEPADGYSWRRILFQNAVYGDVDGWVAAEVLFWIEFPLAAIADAVLAHWKTDHGSMALTAVVLRQLATIMREIADSYGALGAEGLD